MESGWVAVRPNVFEEKEKHKIVFIVAWNEVEGKFAITCHNRTVQRRSICKESLEAVAVGTTEESRAKYPPSPVKDKPNSPYKGTRGGAVIDLSPKKKSPSKAAAKTSPFKTSTVKVAASQARSPDFEVLEPLKDEALSSAADVLDVEELDSLGREDCSWAGLFSFQDLRTIHLQLCSINSDLEPCLPLFPEVPAGMWTVLFGAAEVAEAEVDDLCYRLQVYLGHALDTCGWKILSQVLFTEGDDPEEYYESLSELRQTGYEDALLRAKKHLHEVRSGLAPSRSRVHRPVVWSTVGRISRSMTHLILGSR